MASKFTLSMTETAVNDLDGILEYISYTLSNRQAAKSFYEKLKEAFGTLVLFPQMGTAVDNPAVSIDGVRKLFVNNYTVFYPADYEDDKIYILRIVFSHSDTDEIIRDLGM